MYYVVEGYTMKALQKEIEKWAEEAPPLKDIAEGYANALTDVRAEPSKRNIAVLELTTGMLIAKVMYENGYAPIFEDDQIVGYAPKDLSELN